MYNTYQEIIIEIAKENMFEFIASKGHTLDRKTLQTLVSEYAYITELNEKGSSLGTDELVEYLANTWSDELAYERQQRLIYEASKNLIARNGALDTVEKIKNTCKISDMLDSDNFYLLDDEEITAVIKVAIYESK